jgi:hypothetical protein
MAIYKAKAHCISQCALCRFLHLDSFKQGGNADTATTAGGDHTELTAGV